MYTRFRHTLTLLVALFAAACNATPDRRAEIEETEILRVGTDATFPPFESIDTLTGRVIGFDVDLMRDVCKELGYEVEFVAVPFDHIVAGLTALEYDAIISAFTVTPERRETVLFSDPYYVSGQVMAVRAQDSTIEDTEDLRGRRVGVQLGTTGEELAMRLEQVEVFKYDNIEAAMADLVAENIDAVINDRPPTEAHVAHGDHARIVGDLLSREEYAVAFRRTDAWLYEKFNAALVEYMTTPAYGQLLDRYLHGGAADQPAEP
jgi:ABC-type amino acid transport substrate-binding protein